MPEVRYTIIKPAFGAGWECRYCLSGIRVADWTEDDAREDAETHQLRDHQDAPSLAERPIIWLVPVDDVWLWECRVGENRCHTGSTFHHAPSAAEVAARHVTEHHPTPPVGEQPEGGER